MLSVQQEPLLGCRLDQEHRRLAEEGAARGRGPFRGLAPSQPGPFRALPSPASRPKESTGPPRTSEQTQPPAEEGGRWAVPRAQPAAKPVLLERRETWPGAFSSGKLKSLSPRWRTGWVALELTTVEVTPSFVRLLQQNVNLGNLF